MNVDLEGMLRDAINNAFAEANLDELVTDIAEYCPEFWAEKILPVIDETFKAALKKEGSKLLKEVIRELILEDWDLDEAVDDVMTNIVKEAVKDKLNNLEVNLK